MTIPRTQKKISFIYNMNLKLRKLSHHLNVVIKLKKVMTFLSFSNDY